MSTLKYSGWAVGLGVLLWAGGALAAAQYDGGADDKTIRIGNTEPYSGPASAYGIIGRGQQAYFKMINEHGGVNGRRIEYLSYDDAYSPPKTVEQMRKLIESDDVLAIFNPVGSPSITATIRYINGRKVPELFIGAGGTQFGDYKKYPWTIGWQPPYQGEGRIYGEYIAKTYPDKKIAILSQNDDYGRDNVRGLKEGLGDKVGNIAAQATYESADPTIDSQILKLKASGADILVDITTPKFAAQVIKKLAELDWKPIHILHSNSQSVNSALRPAGLDNAKGIISANYLKDADDAAWRDDPGMKNYNAFVATYLPGDNRSDNLLVYAYTTAQALVEVLKRSGDDLTRANVLKQAEDLKGVQLDLLLPGITLNTSATDHYPIEQMQLLRFDGEKWVRFGPVLEGLVKVD